MDLYTLLIEPMTYQFMQRGLLAALLVGGVSGVIGCFVVVRGLSFFGDALAHSILPGVSLAYIVGADLFVGGLIAGVGSALGIGLLTSRGRLSEDTAIGVVFAGMFALGILIISTVRSYSVDLSHILFGHILGVQDGDLLTMALSGAVVLIAVFLFYKELVAQSFDPGLLRALRLPGEALRLLLLVLIALTIVASLQTVGIALMLALLVTPAATARIFTHRMITMILASSVLGMVSGVIGLYLSWHLNVASGAAVVLTSTAIFILVFSVNRLTTLVRMR
ncbi:MAG: metal ABC transporter permease [Anaerolineae bacterium]|nr:metal ABC transporter permease [Anaerolineae bacterium]NUQ02987.1 metal ABC transporter permease [Anaerolineae bacterium]